MDALNYKNILGRKPAHRATYAGHYDNFDALDYKNLEDQGLTLNLPCRPGTPGCKPLAKPQEVKLEEKDTNITANLEQARQEAMRATAKEVWWKQKWVMPAGIVLAVVAGYFVWKKMKK